jgi:hypothetical protein
MVVYTLNRGWKGRFFLLVTVERCITVIRTMLQRQCQVGGVYTIYDCHNVQHAGGGPIYNQFLLVLSKGIAPSSPCLSIASSKSVPSSTSMIRGHTCSLLTDSLLSRNTECHLSMISRLSVEKGDHLE